MCLATILNNMSPISLDEMSSIRLMNRIDNKFIATKEQLENFLVEICEIYRVQEVSKNRISPYYTIYFDTLDYSMYLAHHNGRAVREKIRVRTYVDSCLTFLEIKNKSNKGRTDKKRIRVKNYENVDSTATRVFLNKYSWFSWGEIHPILENRFDRITLVNKEKTERLTIDNSLRFYNLITGEQVEIPGLVIIELKSDGFSWSPIRDILHQMGISPLGFSKYCIGSILTNKNLKQNNFKQKMILINKLLM